MSHDSNDFYNDDELEHKMIEIAEKQEKIRKIDENFSLNNLQNCTFNFNFNLSLTTSVTFGSLNK